MIGSWNLSKVGNLKQFMYNLGLTEPPECLIMTSRGLTVLVSLRLECTMCPPEACGGHLNSLVKYERLQHLAIGGLDSIGLGHLSTVVKTNAEQHANGSDLLL